MRPACLDDLDPVGHAIEPAADVALQLAETCLEPPDDVLKARLAGDAVDTADALADVLVLADGATQAGVDLCQCRAVGFPEPLDLAGVELPVRRIDRRALACGDVRRQRRNVRRVRRRRLQLVDATGPHAPGET